MSKEAMKLALDALDEFCELGAIIRPLEVRDALREALAEQPAQQRDSVAAECKFDSEEKWLRCEIAHHNLVQSEPEKWPGYQTRLLYTSPPAQRKPLTYVDLRRIAHQCGLGANEVSARTQATADNFARAIEAADGIKE